MSLAGVVASLWSCRTTPLRGGAEVELRLPTGGVDVVFDVTDGTATIAGPTTHARPFRPEPGRELVAFEFVPGDASRLLGARLDEIRDRHVPLAAVWGEETVEEILDRLASSPDPRARYGVLTEFLAQRVARFDRKPSPLGAWIATRIRSDPIDIRISDLAHETGRSLRRLEQIARQELGMPMKRYQRLHRFRRALEGAGDAARIGWAGVAQATGHVDQAHLIAEFRRHAGMTPSVYVEARGPDQNHVASLSS
jgi:AraC-like DNA-binding protein